MAFDSLRQSVLSPDPRCADDNGRLRSQSALRARPISSDASCGPDDPQ